MKLNYNKLEKNGWSAEEIGQLRVKFRKLEQRKGVKHKAANHTIYLLLLLLTIACNILVAWVVLPMVLLINNSGVYLIISILACIFGLLFGVIISEVDYIGKFKHEIIILAVILSCSYSFYRIFTAQETQYKLAGIIYVLLFLLPYGIMIYRRKHYGKH